MTPDQIMTALQMLGPAVAAYMAVKVGLAVAIEKSESAAKAAARAHVRLDDHLAAHK